MAKEVGMICEQGDMGLFYDPLNESDQKSYNEQQRKEGKNNKESNSAKKNSGRR